MHYFLRQLNFSSCAFWPVKLVFSFPCLKFELFWTFFKVRIPLKEYGKLIFKARRVSHSPSNDYFCCCCCCLSFQEFLFVAPFRLENYCFVSIAETGFWQKWIFDQKYFCQIWNCFLAGNCFLAEWPKMAFWLEMDFLFKRLTYNLQ